MDEYNEYEENLKKGKGARQIMLLAVSVAAAVVAYFGVKFLVSTVIALFSGGVN